MSDEETVLSAQIQRGNHADQLLHDDLLKTAMESMECDLVAEVRGLKPSEADRRDMIWRELGALATFKEKLRRYVVTGQRANQTWLQKLTQKKGK